MLPRDLRRKLAQVARGETPDPVEPAAKPERPAPDVVPESPLCHAVIPPDYDLEALGRPITTAGGECFLLEYPASRLVPGTETIPDGLAQAAARSGFMAEEDLYLDLETTGFSSTLPLFLVGVLALRGSELVVSQIFARDYTEEPAVLAHLAELIEPCKRLITFNGRTFDVPFLRDRATFHRQRLILPREHLDLLKIARMSYRGRFRDCRLQTLEEHLCGRRRLEDTPGHLIPDLYHNFVRTRDWHPLRGVLFHNALDLLTMAELMAHPSTMNH